MDLQSVLSKVAPWIAAAAAGPAGLAGMAIKTAAEALGAATATTADEVVAAIGGATPEQLQALKAADQGFKLRMQELGYKNVSELEAIAAGDRKSARDMQVANRSPVPAVLTWFLVIAFVANLAALFLLPVPADNRDILVYMAGQLSGFTAAAVAFWLGTTRESANKTALIAQSPAINA
tara:strand:- start:1180 stop:1716 length:537 start_codon:yes stop_codon:yes gene_type:complete